MGEASIQLNEISFIETQQVLSAQDDTLVTNYLSFPNIRFETIRYCGIDQAHNLDSV